MEFRITLGKSLQETSIKGKKLDELYSSPTLKIEGLGGISISTLTGIQIHCYGDIYGWRDDNHKLHPYKDTQTALKDIFANHRQELSKHLEGRFVIVSIDERNNVSVQRDQFGKIDIYLQRSQNSIVATSDLSLLPNNPGGKGYDQAALAHTLTYYGHRPPKKHTIYNSVTRLGVGETINSKDGNVMISAAPLNAVKQQLNFGEKEEQLYSRTFLDHLEATSSEEGNAIFLSSGWDSTSILAGLVHLRGPQKVRGVIGRMKYSERSGICNTYEIERAQKFAEHYGIKLDIVDLDHLNNAPETVSATQSIFKKHNFQSITGLNHYLLAQKIQETSMGDETTYIGEISDGAHNLGFSQYATIFHPSYDFREYADKMASYLFGPTFIKEINKNNHNNDPIFQLFKSRAGNTLFDQCQTESGSVMKQMLTSFFLRNGRMPFWSVENSKLLTSTGAENYTESMQESYFSDLTNADPEEAYFWYLQLYNSFHWQGSTVLTAHVMADHFGMKSDMPYWDGQLQDILKIMPESYGRGLDFKSTKYPLKAMLENEIPYPKELQTGPHSYTYDTDHSFNHNFELMYHSSLRGVAIERLQDKPYEEILDTSHFNLDYAANIVNQYIAGEELKGAQLADLVSLYLLCQTGWYS